MAKVVHIPVDLWLFIGRALLSRGFIDESTLIMGTLDEPKLKCLLLDKDEWQMYFVEQKVISLNPLEYQNDSESEIAEMALALNMDIKEMIKPENLKLFTGNLTFVEENGFLEYDNVILMSEERSIAKQKETDELFTKVNGEPFFYTVDSFELDGLIHELIHIYEKILGKPIITDIYDTESMLQMQIFEDYLIAHSLKPKDYKLLLKGEVTLKKI